MENNKIGRLVVVNIYLKKEGEDVISEYMQRTILQYIKEQYRKGVGNNVNKT
jgi:hypothetical protein